CEASEGDCGTGTRGVPGGDLCEIQGEAGEAAGSAVRGQRSGDHAGARDQGAVRRLRGEVIDAIECLRRKIKVRSSCQVASTRRSGCGTRWRASCSARWTGTVALSGLSDGLFHKFLQRPYPTDDLAHGVAGIQFLTLNSCWQIDPFNRKRAGLHPEA